MEPSLLVITVKVNFYRFFLISKPEGKSRFILPVGLSTAPFIFTKLLKPVVAHLRKEGVISVIYLDELNWWLNNLKISSFSISDIDYQLEIYSDASKVGWGGVCKGEKTNGFWDSTDSDKHINYLELLGAFNCLKFFTNHKNNLNVLLRIDNTISWKDLSFYAFPPFSLVVKVLKKVKNDQAKGILMVPNWQGQPWFPVFHQMLIAEPFFVGPNKELLLSSTRQLHPLWRKLILVAGLISGKHS